MIQSQWQIIEQMLGQMNEAEKRELISRVANSLFAEPADEELAGQRRALDALSAEMATLPVSNPDDGFCSSDHDRILY
ncbi:MAG TPA: hypothetical protein VGZ26_04875, partial [Pirellulales bacterium]|nr:hypothetical protein [Pirellulales bacterium]